MPNHEVILKTFSNMKSRCYNHDDIKYQYYGGKGFTIDSRWLANPVSFVTWSEQNGWALGKQIHRIDSSRGYEPANCEWIEKAQHAGHHRVQRRAKKGAIRTKSLGSSKYHTATFRAPEGLLEQARICAASEGKRLNQWIMKTISEKLREGAQEK